ncbi:MAG TPA: SRPBCC domain-containing protein [Chiayiivirga sp.]|nr:SRPBCC domain-containing protein [Chiayiivirga sp.]
MAEHDLQLGTLRRVGEAVEGHLGRNLGHGRAAVWTMLTDAASLAQWLAPGHLEPRLGGAVKIDFADSGTVIDSTVLAWEPERVLSWSWSHAGEPERPLRFQLSDAEGGSRLALIVRIPAGEDAAKACAGFEGHLEMLAAALEGVSIKFPFDVFLAARGAYRQQLDGLVPG